MKLKQIRVDGYKNLINCVVNLGDFNVLVGPNNSGKSNLLEAIQMLWPISFGSDDLRNGAFKGLTLPPRVGYSICHLEKHMRKPMTIGVMFETSTKGELWIGDYEVTVQWHYSGKEKGGFLSETLTAKNPHKRGPARRYIWRKGRQLEVLGKPYVISSQNSSLQALRSLYPDFEGLPAELEAFAQAINWIAVTKIFALSPKGLRDEIDKEKPIDFIQVSSFDLSLIVDNIKKEGKYYELFRETLCDILDLEDVRFQAKDMPTPTAKGKPRETAKRMRLFLIKSAGNPYSLVEEYSDGTFAVAAILAVLVSKEHIMPILCLEELENCLHPAAVEKLLRFLQDHADKWPVLITTHSPYLLNGVKPEDVNVAVVDETGGAHFEKVKSSRQLRDYLNKRLMSFGELLVKDFQGFREG